MLRFEFDADRKTFVPGSRLTGRVCWECATIPEEITASLMWNTEGKGTDDADIPIEQTWEPTSEKGEKAISWQLPRGPLSVDGTLLRIRWIIECTSSHPDETVSCDIVLSHTGRPLRLQKV